MEQEISDLTEWLPVIGTLSGAFVGFIASVGTAYLNQNKVENAAKNQRQRERLEALYHTLVLIDQYYLEKFNQVIDNIETNLPLNPSTVNGTSPILQLKMNVNFYFPELVKEHNEFDQAKEYFGILYVKVLSGEVKKMSSISKQNIRNEFIDATESISEKIDDIKTKIFEIAKA